MVPVIVDQTESEGTRRLCTNGGKDSSDRSAPVDGAKFPMGSLFSPTSFAHQTQVIVSLYLVLRPHMIVVRSFAGY